MKSSTASPTKEVLAGLVERVTYHNAENGFCVLRAKARGHRDLVTVVGHSATISAGERITATGMHAYTVRVTNMSPGQVEVESIHLAPAGITDFTLEDAMQTVGDVLSPGETREYQMWVTIVAQGRPTSQFTSNLNSMSVMLACRSESGNFVDSEVVPIRSRS
jgi:hypothetical protein